VNITGYKDCTHCQAHIALPDRFKLLLNDTVICRNCGMEVKYSARRLQIALLLLLLIIFSPTLLALINPGWTFDESYRHVSLLKYLVALVVYVGVAGNVGG